jgi:hypothetical protein
LEQTELPARDVTVAFSQSRHPDENVYHDHVILGRFPVQFHM